MNLTAVMAVLPAEDLDRAKAFYTEKVGLSAGQDIPGGVLLGEGAARLAIYMAGGKSPGSFTQATFLVDDVRATVDELRGKGVVFEEYDLPGLKTEDGIAKEPDGGDAAWFKDTEGNIVGLVKPPA